MKGGKSLLTTDDSPQDIIENLSEPISVYNIDVVADEMAEIISKHTTELSIDDGPSSSVATFKVSNPNGASA